MMILKLLSTFLLSFCGTRTVVAVYYRKNLDWVDFALFAVPVTLFVYAFFLA